MNRSESQILKAVMLEASKMGLRVFRNHVGGFYSQDGSFQRTGLCVGSSDLIGWTECGRFAAIEVKSAGGRASKEQINFIDRVNKAGGFGIIINNEKELKKMLDKWKESK
jgi:hypothetical protein